MDTYFLVYHICNIIFYCLFGLSAFLMLFKIILHVISFMPAKKFPPAKKDHKFAIIIPARNESKVIHQILDSIKAQTYNQTLIDTYLIVEREDDPTCEIAKGYENTHIFIRRHLERKGKGHAMDELFQELLQNENNKYEAYFIFDADNILYPNYIKEMNKVFDQGYDAAVGYRNSKNWNDNWIASCSGLTFMAFNTFDNKPKSRLGLNVTISGTGFYISHRLLKKVGGYKFFTLTEDYEFKLYSTLNNVETTYCESAKFYDEQPTKLKVSWNQRMRWCKGFSQANKIYNKKLLQSAIKVKGKAKVNQMLTVLGIIPIAVTMASIIIYQIVNLALMITAFCVGNSQWYLPLIAFGAAGLALYIFLMLYTFVLVLVERKNIKMNFWRSVITIFMNPAFMLLYLPIYVTAFIKKEVTWVAIEHTRIVDPVTGEIINEEKKKETKEKTEGYTSLKEHVKVAEEEEKSWKKQWNKMKQALTRPKDKTKKEKSKSKKKTD